MENTKTAKLRVKVVPGASSTGIVGWLGEALKVRVSVQPEKGKANAAVEGLVADTLQLPTGSVRVVSGRKSPHKMIEIQGLSKDELLQRLHQKAIPD